MNADEMVDGALAGFDQGEFITIPSLPDLADWEAYETARQPVFTFIATVTIIPFMPDGWAASAGGFPAMVGNVAFLMKDVVLLAVSFYLLKQDLARVTHAAEICLMKFEGYD
ncbi:MAG TPA: DUF417 family protein [Acidobacteriaceae bacterium]|jgi:hypothetical protein